ncbi:uncharacterized protein LOC128546637 [Mercenaria mercenaria]|uniref:uncharacterized protein LOC128546637 n=1 Tax=Mercenaria mercenaria TaxID=6596 RepID=UPI00234EB9EC|nr:uncharacterized protein LOC128546637 [Mercenaria mercenaria]
MLKQRDIVLLLLFCFFNIQQNLLDLAAASKDLEASTVALECSYSDSTRASQSSLNSSSGYGTMNSTPAVSVDTKASCDENKSQCWKDVENLTLNDAQLLFDKGLLPDRHILSVMVRRHGMKSEIVVLVCENICKTIAAVSSEFLHVFGAYDKENRLHFVVYTETESIQNSELDFDYEILFRSCKRNEQNDHMSIIAESEGELLAEESVALGKTVKSISKRFMDKHKYLSVITARKILSEGRENLCIVMYVHPCTDRYSSIPHTEDPIPTEIQGYKVVVRNGVFKTATKTAAEYHDNLRMGCQITSNHVNGFGTLGGFIDHPEYGLCGFTCAHVVCSSEQMVNLKRNKRLKWPTSDHCSVYQPSQHTMPVGRVVEAIYTEGGDSGSAGVDLALFQIENRPPVSGSFPRCNSNEKLRYNMGTTWGKSRIAPSVREVQKFGVATGITKGNVWFDGMSVRELPFVTKRALHSVDTILYNQYEVVNDIRHFCEQGDSGGLVFMKDCFNELICIGMVNGVLDTVSPFHGVVTPITDILRELNVQNLKPFKQELTLDNLEKRLSEHAAATRVQMQSHINESVSTAASNMLDKMMEVQSAFQREVQSSLAHMYALLQKQTPDSSTKTDGNNSGDE